MKAIRNDSLQSIDIFLKTPKIKAYMLKPGETKVVPNHFVSDQIINLARRRVLTVNEYRG